MSDEEDESISEGFSASEDEWIPGKGDGKHDGESSDDDDSDFEESTVAGAASSKSQGATRKKETKSQLKGTSGGVTKKRKPMGQSLRARLYNKYRPPPKTLQGAMGSDSPRASTSSKASKNALTPNEVSAIFGDQNDDDDDGSSSDSSVGNHLVNPADLDLRSSFFNVDGKDGGAANDATTAPPVFDCNAGIANLTDSDSENEEDEAQKVSGNEMDTSKAFDFRNLLENANSLERMKEQIAMKSSAKSSKVMKSAKDDVTTLLALGENQQLKNNIINPDDEEDDEDDDDDENTPRASSKLSKTKSTRIKRHKKTRPASTVVVSGAGDSDDSDWEEVADDDDDNDNTNEKEQTQQFQDGLEILVEPGNRKRSKEAKTQEELEMAFRRRLNRDIKDQQLFLHKTSLLCLFGRSYHYNRLLNNTELMQAALKLLPGAKSYPKESGTELKYFQSFITWFKTVIKLANPNLYPNKEEVGKTSKDIKEGLMSQIKRGQARCKQDMVFIFIALLRGMGIQCRLIINMQPLPLKPSQQDLLPIKLKPEMLKKSDVNVVVDTKINCDDVAKSSMELKKEDGKLKNKKENQKSRKAREQLEEIDSKKKLNEEKRGNSNLNKGGKKMSENSNEENENKRNRRTKRSSNNKDEEEAKSNDDNKIKSLRKRLERNIAAVKEMENDHNYTNAKKTTKNNNYAAAKRQNNKLKEEAKTKEQTLQKKKAAEEETEKKRGKHKSIKEQLQENIADMKELERNPWKTTTVGSDVAEQNQDPELKAESTKKPKKKPISRNANASSTNSHRRSKRQANEQPDEVAEAKVPKTSGDHHSIKANILSTSLSKPQEMQERQLTSSKNIIPSRDNASDSGINLEVSSCHSSSGMPPLDGKLSLPKVAVVVADDDNETENKSKASVCPTISQNARSRSRSSSRSVSPRPLISTEFLESKLYKEKFAHLANVEEKPATRKAKPKEKKAKISTDFMTMPQETKGGRVLRSRRDGGGGGGVASNPTDNNVKNGGNTLNIPQLDGADDNDDLECCGKSKKTKKKTSELGKRPKKTTRTSENDSDEDFLPSPPKQPKRAPVLPKALDKLRKDRRVLSTDNDSDVGSESLPTKIKKGTAADIWSEVWSDVENRWICVDLFKGKLDSLESIRKSASSPLAYVFAFQNDLTLKDVTARYCLNWSTIIRKDRVPKSWLETAISAYYGIRTERDVREDHELRRIHEEKEMPKSIAEFKDHPLYALERHLLKFQAIYPPNAPTFGFTSRGDPIYSRDCVHTLHSREIWLKQARTVKLGEKPYKIVKARPKWDRITQSVIKDLPLEIFGFWQTEDYEPPTAENGIVPRNAYGNVELFKECMLPKKTVHIRLPGLNRICKKLGIDCANAVIGFDFHQGSCHPTYDGFVICEEYADKVTEAWHQDQEEQERKEQEKYESRVYGNWKKLIRGLLIRERLKKKYNM